MSIEPLPAEYGAWNPGLESQLPREYLPLSTAAADITSSRPKIVDTLDGERL
jgi:hypothetical protein